MSRFVHQYKLVMFVVLLTGLLMTSGLVNVFATKPASGVHTSTSATKPAPRVHKSAATGGPPSVSANHGTLKTGGATVSGTKVTVTGTNFGAGETITLSLNSQSLTTVPNPLLSANDGSFTGTFVVPKNLAIRAYPLVASGQSSGISASVSFWLRAPSENVYAPTTGQTSYQINDTDPREPQMNYLRLTNKEDANLVNPTIMPDSVAGQDPFVDTSSPSAIVKGVLAAHPGDTTDAQKTFDLWQWLSDYEYHYFDSELPDPKVNLDTTAVLNNYAETRCWLHARLMADLFYAAGYPITAIRSWNLATHAVTEVSYGGAWHLYDADQKEIYLAADGTVLGVQDLIANPHPIVINATPGGLVTQYHGSSDFYHTAPFIANLYATTGDNQKLYNYPDDPHPHSLNITLRKNETLMENWSNVGKYHDIYSNQVTKHPGPPPVYENGDIVYTPDLSQASYQNGVLSQTNVSSSSQDGLQPNLHAQTTGTTSSVVYQVHSPYTLVGSLLSAQTYLATNNDSLSISLSLDNTNWNSVYTQTTTGYANPQLDLSQYLNVLEPTGTLPEQYTYYVKFQWTANSAPNGAGLASFNLDSQFEQAWEAIPPLHSGTTNIAYSDQTGSGGRHTGVQVTYGWTSQPTADLSGSSFQADYPSIPADGNTLANAIVNLKTSGGTAVPNMIVGLSSTGVPARITRIYHYQGLRGQTDSNGQAIFEVRSSQAGSVTLTATDKNGTPIAGLAPVTITFTAPPAVMLTTSQGSSIINGDFEKGDLSGWTAGGSVTPASESSSVHSGTYAAQLGATAASATPTDSSLMETLTMPVTPHSLNLAYQFSNPTGSTQNYLEVDVRDTAGDTLNQLFVTSTDSGNTWQTLNLTGLSLYGLNSRKFGGATTGNTIQIAISVHQGKVNKPAAAFGYVDDVQIS